MPLVPIPKDDLNISSAQMDEFKKTLLSDQEFFQAIKDNNIELLNQRNYTPEQFYRLTPEDYRPLELAIANGHAELAKRFLCEGAPLVSNVGSILNLALEKTRDVSLIALICDKKPSLVKQSFQEPPPLHTAVRVDWLEAVACLVAHHADVNETYAVYTIYNHKTQTQSLFDNALLHEDKQIAKWLLTNCPKLEISNAKLRSCDPFIKALNENTEIFALMLPKLKGDINTKDDNGCTLLFFAVLYNKVEIAKLLIANGANVNTKDIENNTLFHGALLGHNDDPIPMLQVLIDAGASILEVNKDDLTPIELAKKLGKLKEKAMLEKYLVATSEDVIATKAEEIQARFKTKSNEAKIFTEINRKLDVLLENQVQLAKRMRDLEAQQKNQKPKSNEPTSPRERFGFGFGNL